MNVKSTASFQKFLSPKLLTISHACNSPIQKLNDAKSSSVQLCMWKIWIFEKIQNENSKWKWKLIKH